MTVDPLGDIYNERLLQLAAGGADRPLENAPLSARAISPICGSEVQVDLALDAAGRVAAIGFSSEACALARCVLSVLSRAAPGKDRDTLLRAGQDLGDMLAGTADGPTGDFADLRILAPARDYKARHNAILLPFEALEKAFAKQA